MRIPLLLPALAGAMTLNAQSFPFPVSDAIWVQHFETMVSPLPLPVFAWLSSANFQVDGSDTLIAGTNYTQLQQVGAGYVGGLREAAGAVYFHPADSTQEYLLYDFGAAVGDTLYGIYVNEELAMDGSSGWLGARLLDVKVVSSSMELAHGGRIRVQVQAIDPLIGMDSEWIEGMGCIHGLFTFNPLNVSNYWFGLDCFSHNDTTYWNGWYAENPGICAPQFMSVREQGPTVVRAYPNPTTGVVRLEGMDSDLLLRDGLGRSVQIPMTPAGYVAMDLHLGTLPPGMYMALDGQGRTVRLSKE